LEHLDVTGPTEAITANKLTSDPCSIASASPKDKKLADEIIVVMPRFASIPARKLEMCTVYYTAKFMMFVSFVCLYILMHRTHKSTCSVQLVDKFSSQKKMHIARHVFLIWNGPSGDWVTNFVPKNAWFLSKR
jgi:hypothetical protein